MSNYKLVCHLCAVIFLSSGVSAANPVHEITFQGRLSDDGGQPVRDGEYVVEFTVFQDSITETILWTGGEQGIKVVNGAIRYILAIESSTIGTVLSARHDLWLGITISGSMLSPRLRLTVIQDNSSESDPDELEYRIDSHGESVTGSIGSSETIRLVVESDADYSSLFLLATDTVESEDTIPAQGGLGNAGVVTESFDNERIERGHRYSSRWLKALEQRIRAHDTTLFLIDLIEYLNETPSDSQAIRIAKSIIKNIAEEFLSQDTISISVRESYDRAPGPGRWIEQAVGQSIWQPFVIHVVRSPLHWSEPRISVNLTGRAVGGHSKVGYIHHWSDVSGTVEFTFPRLLTESEHFSGHNRGQIRDYKYKIDNKAYHPELRAKWDQTQYWIAFMASNFGSTVRGWAYRIKSQVVLAQGISGMPTQSMMTPLMYAARHNYEGIISLLLAQYADVNAVSDSGETALLQAVRKNYSTIVDLLLLHDAETDLASTEGLTPLMIASQGGYTDIVHSLVQHGASTDLVSKSGETALLHAVFNGHYEIVRELVQHGADVNFQYKSTYDDWDRTPLMLAVRYGCDEIAGLLIARGADISIEDNNGWNALDWGRAGKDDRLVATLSKHCESMLHDAASAGNDLQVKKLFTRGIDINARRKDDGTTALILAAQHGRLSTVQLLLELSVDSLLDRGSEANYKKSDYDAVRKFNTDRKANILKHVLDVEQSIGQPVIPVLGTILSEREVSDGSGKRGPEAYLVYAGNDEQVPTRIATDGSTEPVPASIVEASRAIMEDLLIAGRPGAQAGTVLVLTLDAMREDDHLRDVLMLLIDQTAANEDLTDQLKLVVFADDKPVAPEGNSFVELFSRVILKTSGRDFLVDINAKDKTGGTALSYARRGDHKDIVALLLKSGAR